MYGVYAPGVYTHMTYNDIMYDEMYAWCMNQVSIHT